MARIENYRYSIRFAGAHPSATSARVLLPHFRFRRLLITVAIIILPILPVPAAVPASAHAPTSTPAVHSPLPQSLLGANRARAWALLCPHLTNSTPDTTPAGFRQGSIPSLHWFAFGWPEDHDGHNCPWLVVFLDSRRRLINEQLYQVHADLSDGYTPLTFLSQGTNGVFFYFSTQSWGTGLSMSNWRLFTGPRLDPKSGTWRPCREVFGGMRQGYVFGVGNMNLLIPLFGDTLKPIPPQIRTLQAELDYRLLAADRALLLRRSGRLRVEGSDDPKAKPAERATPWVTVNDVYRWDPQAELFRPAY